jgi:hypothetical protein
VFFSDFSRLYAVSNEMISYIIRCLLTRTIHVHEQGDGLDLCIDTSIACGCPKYNTCAVNQKKKKRHNSTCTFCSNSYIVRTLCILNKKSRCLQQIYLCKKHYISANFTDNMYEINDIHNFLLEKQTRGRRRVGI